ncbi:MAG: lipopolysaccharide kinase InaA family protein [Thermodesulfobacteriota bacterium]|nr:lipopolysaccharide kinase InaA family protein [Thermodesulfobacteriota bacterium]
MNTPPFMKVSQGEIKGWVREDITLLLPPAFLEDPVTFVRGTGGKVIKESKLRWAAIFTLSSGRKIFIKKDKTKGWLEIFKYFILPSKGRKEWFIAHQLRKRNLNIPRPLGWMERIHRGLVKESYYLSEAVESGVSLAEVADILKDEKISTELVKTVIRIHSSGLLHQDLHAGNFLWDGESFFLIDLHRARLLRFLSLNQRLWNLSRLFHSLRSIWGEKEHLRFLDQYFEGDSISSQKEKEYLMKIHSWMDRLQRRQWQSRTKRCLKESTEFSVKKEKGITIYSRNDLSLDRLKKMIESHLTFVREKPSDLLKNSPEVKVSLVEDGEDRVCVKQFCYPRFRERFKDHLRLSKGLKAWLGGNGLRVRGVSSVKPLALMEQKSWFGRIESFLVMEASKAEEEMDRYTCKEFDGIKGKRNFIKAFALWLYQFHQRNIYHQDMKACNILVSRNGQVWDFKLLDLEDVLLDEKINEKNLFKNLLQLNTSTPKIMTTRDRLRFFKEYMRLNPIIKEQKVFLQHLMEESKKRGLVYVSPQGVVSEKL